MSEDITGIDVVDALSTGPVTATELINNDPPEFEGIAPVEVITQVTGAVRLEGYAPVASIDDRIRVVSVLRVVGVTHKENKDGDIVRTQLVKPVEMKIVPFVPGEDDGVVRVRELDA